MDMVNLHIHSFESMASLDGEGIRYGVFLVGCPLRCAYCHNPDTWSAEGTLYTPEKLAAKIKRYKPYFGDDGGVTFSGGEPLLSAAGINETAKYLAEDNIGYALDTSGCVPLSDEVKKAVDNASMIICDLKMWDDESYKKYTGMDMKHVLEFLDYVTSYKKRLWIRTVVVPGINDDKEILDRYCEIVKRYNPEKYELLAFHTMGFFKYEKLGIDNPLKDIKALEHERLNEFQEYVNMKIQ